MSYWRPRQQQDSATFKIVFGKRLATLSLTLLRTCQPPVIFGDSQRVLAALTGVLWSEICRVG